MFILFLALAMTLLSGAYLARGPRMALAIGFAMLTLLPTWMGRNVGAVFVDFRFAVPLMVFALLLFGRTATWAGPLRLGDLAVLGMAASLATTELLAGGLTVTVAMAIGATWLVPYFFARLIRPEFGDLERVGKWMAAACLVLAMWTVLESVTHVNPISVFAQHVGSLQAVKDVRWGLRRAEGPTSHPIFLGQVYVLLFPWAIYAAARARSGNGPNWWKYLPWAMVVGVFFTMSRGPLLSLALGAVVMAAQRRPALRAPLVLGAGFALVALVLFWQPTVRALEHITHDDTRTVVIHIDGKPYFYNGTRHRVLQVLVFSETLRYAGWLGYGTAAMKNSGGTALPYVEPGLRATFSSIDNHYLQFTLQNGYLGTALFLTIGIWAAARWWRIASLEIGDRAQFAAAACGAIASSTLMLVTVWFPPDFGVFWLFNAGLAAAVAPMRRSVKVTFTPRPMPRRRLVPGHPDFSLPVARLREKASPSS